MTDEISRAINSHDNNLALLGDARVEITDCKADLI